MDTTPMLPAQPVKVFLAYSPEDEEMRDGLMGHLASLTHSGEIKVSDAGRIPSAAGRPEEVDKSLDAAQIILFLVSPGFLASDYFTGGVVERAARRHEAGEALVAPVLLRSCAWEETRLSRFDALPNASRPVVRWSNIDEAFEEVAAGIRNLVGQVRERERRAPRSVEFAVEEGDITAFEADVAVLKYAQQFYGADSAVMDALREAGVGAAEVHPAAGEHVYLPTRGGIRAPHALFVGTPELFEFDYEDIRGFSARALEVLARENPAARHVSMTIHGVGYGLDETEVAYAQFAGLRDAIDAGQAPPALERITVLDINSARVGRLRVLFDSAFKPLDAVTRAEGEGWVYRLEARLAGAPGRGVEGEAPAAAAAGAAAAIESAGVRAKTTPHVFVAMPFREDMDDVFYYGIQAAVRAAGYICERIDEEAFTGDILERLKARIETSSLVIADLTGDNPNVFLEVGYAWGKGRPTVLVARQGDRPLRFDVQGQRCIRYKSIRNLEEELTKMLGGLKAEGTI